MLCLLELALAVTVFAYQLIHDADSTTSVAASKQCVMVQMVVQLVQSDTVIIFVLGLGFRAKLMVLIEEARAKPL